MTDPIQFHQHVGADGILSLQVPLGPAAANADVLVTVEPLAGPALDEDPDEKDWHAFVESTYGSCAGLGLERQDQGTLEKREPLQ
jgi:hypothetical protein